MVPQIKKKNLWKLKIRSLKRNRQARTICKERFVMESNIELNISKIVAGLRIEAKVWEQRAEAWEAIDDTNHETCMFVVDELKKCREALGHIKAEHKACEGVTPEEKRKMKGSQLKKIESRNNRLRRCESLQAA